MESRAVLGITLSRTALVSFLSLLCGLQGCGGSEFGGGYGRDGVVRGPLLTSVGKSEDGMFAEVTGPVTSDDGCLRLGDMPVVWPEGTTWDSSSKVLTLPGGEEVATGEKVSGGGGYLPPRAVKDLFGPEVADAARPCLGPTREIAVFNPGWEVAPTE